MSYYEKDKAGLVTQNTSAKVILTFYLALKRLQQGARIPLLSNIDEEGI